MASQTVRDDKTVNPMPVEIVAEVAQGYEGDPSQARLLARAAARAGADAVKFQLIYADELCTPDYQYYDLFKGLEMPRDAWERARDEARAAGLRFYMDVSGARSFREAMELGVDGIKIHSTDFYNSALVRRVLAEAPRVYLSLGGVTVEDLETFLKEFQVQPSESITLMFGYQAEPTPVEANHLARLHALKQRFPNFRWGFLDHSDGGADEAQTLALLSLGIGVVAIEKHITLDRLLEIEDYVSGLAPAAFKEFAGRVRHLEKALGSSSFQLTPPELEYRGKVVKSIVATRAIRMGEEISADSVALKRAAVSNTTGLVRLEQVLGRTATRDIPVHAIISEEVIQ